MTDRERSAEARGDGPGDQRESSGTAAIVQRSCGGGGCRGRRPSRGRCACGGARSSAPPPPPPWWPCPQSTPAPSFHHPPRRLRATALGCAFILRRVGPPPARRCVHAEGGGEGGKGRRGADLDTPVGCVSRLPLRRGWWRHPHFPATPLPPNLPLSLFDCCRCLLPLLVVGGCGFVVGVGGEWEQGPPPPRPASRTHSPDWRGPLPLPAAACRCAFSASRRPPGVVGTRLSPQRRQQPTPSRAQPPRQRCGCSPPLTPSPPSRRAAPGRPHAVATARRPHRRRADRRGRRHRRLSAPRCRCTRARAHARVCGSGSSYRAG